MEVKMKIEVRKHLSLSYRKHWIDAFLKLKYKKELSDEKNIKLFDDWAWHTNWKDVKVMLDKTEKTKWQMT